MSRQLMGRIALLALLLALLAGTASAAPATAQGGPVLTLDPAEFTLAAGEEQTLNVRLTGVENLGGFQFDLLFPPEQISLSSVTLGPLLASTGRNAMPLGPIREPGRISFGGFTFGETAGAAGDGIVAVLTLRGEAPGRGELRLEKVQVLDITGADLQPTAVSGTLTVTGDAPAPTVTPGAAVAPTEPALAASGEGAPAPAPQSAPTPTARPAWLTSVLLGAGLLLLLLAAAQFVAGRRPGR